MNKTELDSKIAEYEKKKRELDILQSEIESVILELKESYQSGNTIIKYSSGRRTFDYESAGQFASDDIISRNTHSEEITDWAAVCKEAGIKDVPFTKGEPSAKIGAASDSKKEFKKSELINKDSLPF